MVESLRLICVQAFTGSVPPSIILNLKVSCLIDLQQEIPFRTCMTIYT